MADGMWQVGNQNQALKAKGWGPRDKCLPAADSYQHHLHNLPCGPRKPFRPRKKSSFLTVQCENVIENKGLT